MSQNDRGPKREQPPPPTKIENATTALALGSPAGWLLIAAGSVLSYFFPYGGGPFISALIGFAMLAGAWLILAIPVAWLVCLIITLFRGGFHARGSTWLSAIPLVTVFNPLTALLEMCAVFRACV